jgi:hypothetical protein
MNWDKIEQLLNIAEGSLKFGTKTRPIHDAALKELEEHAKPKPEPKAIKAEESEPENNGKLKRRSIDG